MNRFSSILLWGALVLEGCSPGGSPSPKSTTTTTTQATECGSTSQSCYCPDGTQSGTQSCDAQQGLSGCVCPETTTPVDPSQGTGTTTPAQVCDDLKGSGACDAKSFASQQVPSSILFVVDRSGSMACNAPPVQSDDSCNAVPTRADPKQPSKWETTVKALNGAFAGLSGTTSTVGLSLFSTDGSCGADSTPSVELAAPSSVQLTALSDAMAASTPAGGTPIVGAVIEAYHHLHQDLHAGGNRYVVVMTDGEEDCGTKGDPTDTADVQSARDQLLNVEVEKARDANIRTFVIGSPGSEAARGFLSELAFRGGTARTPDCAHDPAGGTVGDCHYDLTTNTDFAGVLSAALGSISGKAIGCEFQTPAGATNLLNVQYSHGGSDPVCFPQDTDPCDSGANGWQFAKDSSGNDDTTRVVLCGAACDSVKADPTAVVDVILGCPAIH